MLHCHGAVIVYQLDAIMPVWFAILIRTQMVFRY